LSDKERALKVAIAYLIRDLGFTRTQAEESLNEKIEKAGDWCSQRGGKWITVRGKHICIGKDYEYTRGGVPWKGSHVIHDKYNKSTVNWKKNVIDENTVMEIKSGLQHYPKSVKVKVNEINITDGYLDTGVTGLHQRSVDTNYSWITLSTDDDVIGVFHHEMGHRIYYDYVSGIDAMKSDWSRIRRSEVAYSLLAGSDVEEDFCESLRFYKTRRKELRNECPERFEYIHSLMEAIEDES